MLLLGKVKVPFTCLEDEKLRGKELEIRLCHEHLQTDRDPDKYL